MSDITPDIAADVVAACQAGAGEAAEALGRALDAEGLAIEVGEAGAYAADSLEGPGLAVLFTFGGVGVVGGLPKSSGLLPDWVESPDATGESKLSTLAQELSMLLVPETLMADEFQAAWVDDLPAAFARAGAAEDAALVPLTLTAGESSGQLSLLWPVATPGELFPAAEADAETPAEGTTEEATDEPVEAPAESAPSSGEPALGPAMPQRTVTDFADLPSYSRSLLHVEVPVTVRLAAKKQSVQEIVEMGPGSIIMFEKSCDDPVHLTVGDLEIAMGEVVKVGEKFGLRVQEMVMPDESFKTVGRSA